MSLPFFLRSLADQGDRERIDDGLKAAVRQYYQDFTDAEYVDVPFWRALIAISEYGTMDVDEIIADVEQDLHSETGRKFMSDPEDS